MKGLFECLVKSEGSLLTIVYHIKVLGDIRYQDLLDHEL